MIQPFQSAPEFACWLEGNCDHLLEPIIQGDFCWLAEAGAGLRRCVSWTHNCFDNVIFFHAWTELIPVPQANAKAKRARVAERPKNAD